MSKIISIGKAVPAYRHRQDGILHFMQNVYAMNPVENRKLAFLYRQSGIDTRYSVIPDYSQTIHDWEFYPQTENLDPFPSLEKRMACFDKHAAPLSTDAILNCIHGIIKSTQITHLITVSCTGMSAPGLDLQVIELLNLDASIYRTSVNFMGCYAAIHALKIADAICSNDPAAKVIIVCTELCTLHFQREASMNSITSGLLFADGSAAVLVTHDSFKQDGLHLKGFYSEIIPKGKKDMSWELSSTGFLMTLSGYVPELIEEDFNSLVNKASAHIGIDRNEINEWCIHPGGKRILDAIYRSLHFKKEELAQSYSVLKEYGNMSSPTILFVLEKIMMAPKRDPQTIFAAAFGPGLTMETFIASAHA
ncbi:MAG: type polyketide synthase [Chitinophagaceae bacterium]|nr:type polyketide synthase [Chitinophagaceae bacterium]